MFLAAKCSGSHDGMRVICHSLGYPGYRDLGAACVTAKAAGEADHNLTYKPQNRLHIGKPDTRILPFI